MSDFYQLQGKMKSLVNGDMAKESLELAEDEHMIDNDRLSQFDNIHLYGKTPIYDDSPDYIPVLEKDGSITKCYREFRPKRKVVMGIPCLEYFRDDYGWMGVWRKGDIWFNGTEYKYVPDSWDYEDVRLNEVVYRPI